MGTTMSKGVSQRERSRQELLEESKVEEHGSSSLRLEDTESKLERLSGDIFKAIGSHLATEDIQTAESQFQRPSRGRKTFFQEILDEAKAVKLALKAVVTGNPDALIKGMLKNRQVFFMKGNIIDLCGRMFREVSAAQMIAFLCDDDMNTQVKCFIEEKLPMPELHKFISQWQAQVQELGQGGADLIKLGSDPLLDPDFHFNDSLTFRNTYHLYNNDRFPQRVHYSLLGNPDGIAYYKDEQNQAHWYYLNQETQTISAVELTSMDISAELSAEEQEILQAQQQAYDELEAAMDAMEPLSARRSTNAEHQVIASTMKVEGRPVALIRQGIQYERKGENFCDSRHDFNRLYNGYRKCLRFYQNFQMAEGNKVFREELDQGAAAWVAQRFCEEDRPFVRLNMSTPFQRTWNIYHMGTKTCELIYNDNSSSYFPGFGSEFALYKGNLRCETRFAKGLSSNIAEEVVKQDFIAINKLIEKAKSNTLEFEQNLARDETSPIFQMSRR